MRSVTRPSFPLAYLGRVLGLLSLLALLPPSVSAQSPGDVDSLNLGISGSEVMVTAVQPDGKMILAGTFTQVLGGARNNIARVNADGTLDTGFDPNVNGAVYTVAVQADGKVLLGGNFSTLSPNGGAAVTRYNIARVNADGTLDTSFDPNANSTVNTVVVQADGKVLLGGNFTALSTNGGASVARYSIARVNADGTLDTGFNPNADNAVRSLVVQADGKVLLGGNFTTLSPNGGASVTRNRIARVNADGTLDTGFNPNASNVVRSLAVQADGKVLLGGDFTTLSPNGGASVTRYYIARVNADGTLDTGFDPNPNATVHCVVVQADGRVLLGGGFVILSPNGGAVVTRGTVARMNADGSLDTGFNPNANGGGGSATYSVAVQTDGKVLLGGSFSTLSPNGGAAVPRNRFARLYNDATTQTLAATSPTQADWQRGGAGPELEQVSFALSTDGGTNYSALPGTATRVGTTANWRLTGLSLPASGHLRARGRTSGGFQNGSSGLIEQVLAFSGLVTVPTVTNISPTSGSTTGGTSVTITGTNFSGTPIVTIGGVPATSVVVVDATTITCTTPPGTGTAKDVVVTISGTPSTGGTGLFSYNAPTITGISPTTGSTAGGTSVTITGTNFGGTPTVTIGGNPASSVVVVDATTITAVTPAGTAGARDVVVTVSGQSSTGGTGIYTYLAPPVVALNGANLLSNAVTMTINGSGFSNTPGNNTVVFSPSGTGTVTASGFFQLTVSGITGLTAGPLYAVVTTNGLSSGAPVQVRTVVTPVAGDPLPFNAQVVSGGGIISSATQPDGKIIIAGLFTSVGGVPRTNIARLNADGTLDAGFNPVPNAQVTSVLVQPDGKILMGGNFTQVNGQARTYLARLAADGTLEGYNPPIDNAVHSLTAQADGAVIIAGSFTNFTGAARAGLARIDQYYGFDSSFNPNADGTVESVVVEPDGDILLGGSFFNVGGTARQYMARVSSTGVLDTSFTPTSNLPVTCMELQADGKIVVGGHFTQMNGVTRNNFARLNADGTLDTGFNPQGNGAPYDIAVQADGKILFAGDFTAIAATVRNRVARVNADGSLDTGFNPNVGNMVYNVSLQSNGSVLIAGAFGDVGGYLRSNLALLLNDTATQTLVADSASQITWTRSGAAPDVSRVTFERSGDGGSTWTTLGNGSRVGTTSNYQLTGLSLPATGQIRARGRTNSGWRSASASLIEQVASYSVTPPNTAPTDITLTPSSIAENNAANATVGTLAAVDADSGQTHTFTKVTGTGDTDNASFSISGTDLILIPSANFEVKSSYSVRVQADDGNGGTFAKALTVTITNVNEVPTDIASAPAGAVVGGPGVVVWGTPVTFNDNPSQVSTVGLRHAAVRFNSTDLVVNGVTFDRYTGGGTFGNGSLISTTTSGSFPLVPSPAPGGTGAYGQLVNFGGFTSNNSASIQINGLTPGNLYQVQLFMPFFDNLFPSNFSSAGGSTVTLSCAGPGYPLPDVVVGTFLAGSTTQTINWTLQSTYGGLAAISVRSFSLSTNENNAPGAAIGTLTATDPDAGSTHTFSLVSGAGDADNGAFTLATNGTLTINGTTDFETKSSYSIRVQADDGNGGTFAKAFTVTVTNVNEVPTLAAISKSGTEDITVTFTAADFTSAFSDPDSDALSSITVVTLPATGALKLSGSNVAVSQVIPAANLGNLTYVPAADENGAKTFTLTASDGSLSSSPATTVTMTLTAVNDAPSFALSASPSFDPNWVQQTSPTLQWTASASSADGMKLVAAAWPGNIYTSADRGVTWTQRASTQTWAGLASSSDGTKLVACAAIYQGAQIYTSADSGVTWTARPSAGSRDWTQVASSADGTKLVACVWNGGVYTSTDSGANWTLRSAAGTRNWSCVASSADGTKLAATSWQGNIYTSDDSGATWTARDSVRTWWTVTMSADGTKLGAGLVDGGGPIYISTDSGATWTPSNSGNINFGSISCSEDFSTVVAVGNGSGSRVYISYDSGVNWVIAPNSPVGSGESISISADGSTIVYPMHNGTGGKIYTTINEAILTVNEDSGASSRANFAASISAGPANESAQTVSFTVTNDNNALFSVQPAIDAGGALTFTPAANANGSAIVSVTAVDSGSGTAPNVNSSAAQTFTLTVTPVNDAPVITSNGGGATDSLNIAENTTAVTTAVAIDSDLPAQTVTYSKSGTHAALFNIGSSTGVLTFASAPDFETNPGPFSVTVTATDNGSPNLSDTQDLTINVTDVNEAPTAISGGAGGASGVISWSPINTFNDNPSQVLTNGTRHAAVCFAGLDLTVNGVVFDRWIGSGVFGNASKISLPIDVFTGNYASGGSGTYGSMLSRGGFHYMANPYFDITGLTPGSTYQVQIFMPFWDQLYPTLFGSTGGSSVTLQCGKPASPHPAPDVLVGTFTASGTTQRVLWGSTAPALLGAVSVRSLPSLVVPENNAPNATIETFAAADQDAGSTHAFTLVSGTGSDDNGAFTLSTSGLLTINSSTDFETKSSYAIRIRATDTGGLFVEQAFVVTVTNVNEAVLALALTGSSVNENAAVNTTVGTLSSTDTDLADTHTYALVTGTGDTDNASFNISGSALRTSAALDYEAGTTRSIRVRTTDAGGLFFEQAFTITVANVNETPTDIALSSNTTPENVAANSTIGTLSTTDPDAGNTFTYSLVSGTGSTDNASFNISSNALRITASPNFEAKSSYAVRVRSTDQGGLFFEKAFTISISDVNEVPTAITFTGGAPAGTLYASGLTARMVYSSGSITGLAYADGMLLNGTNVASEYSGPISYVDFADYNTAGRFPGVLPFPGRASLTDFNQAVLQVTGTITVPTNGTYTFAVRSDDGSRIKIDGITVFSDDTFHGENEYYTPVNLTAGTHSLDFVFFEGGGGAQVELFVATGSYTSYNGSFGLLRAYPVSVAENNAIGAAVGTLAATDPDGGSSHTFELVSGTGDTDNASFTLSPAGALSINISTDYEVKSSYSIRVRATDNGTPGLSFEQTAIVSVTNVNEGPTTLALTGSSVNENAAANTTVGTLSTTDPDAADTFTYTLVSGTGSTDNASFNISGSTLRANAGIDFEAGATRSIRVRTTDAGGLFAEDSFTITINNVNEIPSFVKGGDQRHPYQTSGSQSVTSWATSMSDGDSTVVQALSFNTSNNANGMFSVQPAVSSAGDLTYTLSGTSGVATVSVSITDDNTINGNAALTSAVQTFTITVDPQPDYTVTTTATTIALTNVTNTSDTLSFTNGGTSGVFAATGRTFSLNGGLNQSDSISLTYASYPGINSIVIDGAGGNDTINVGDFSALPGFAGLTIHGGAGDDTVNFNGDISFDADLNLDVDLQNDHATPGTDTVNVAANANLATSGNGAISVKASRNIAMASGSSFATVNGALTLEANQQIVPTTGDFLGLHSDGGQISASGTGVVTVKSRAGDGMTNTYGIFLENGAGISGGTIGTVLVEGTGGAGSGDFNIGVNVRNSSITSAGADTVVNGTGGGTGASSGNWGVNVEVVGSITAGGSGTVSVTGQGGNSGGTGGNNYGVHVRFLGSVTSSGGAVSVTGTAGGGAGDFNIGVNVSSGSITSLGGNVSVAGTAAGTGVSANNWGVNIEHSGEITAGGSGTVTIAGIGGNTTGTGGSNYGVLLRHSGVATSSGGALSVTGTGGGSSGASDNLGINVTLSSSITTAANGGTNTITADSMNFDGTAVISAGPSGTVVLRQKSNLTAIDLGSVSDSVIGTLELSDAELDRITADVLTIGKAAAGNLTVSAALSPANVTTLNLVSGGTIADTNTSGADITVASLTTAGTLAPGASPGLFSVAGNHSIVSGSAYNVELGGLTAGTLHDQLNVAGTVTIGTGVTLNVSTISAFEPQPGDEFVLVSNDGSDAVSGTFNGLPEGANILLGTLSTVLTYTGGDGNDIVLRRPAIIPLFLGATSSTGGGSGSGTIDAPNEDATASLGKWESIRQGAVISSNGHIAFRGHLELGTGSTPVTVDDFQGIWRYDGTNTRLKARSGSAAPEAGGALYDMLPLNPAISPDGLITFYGTLRMGTGTPATTASTYYGLWSEIGGGGSVRLLLREGDVIVSGKTFRSGFAVSGSSANTAALNVKLSSGSALLHLDVNTPSVLLTVVAEEGQTAPGGGTWVALDGNSSDPRLSANGDLGFIGWEKVGNSQIQGIYSRLNSTAVGTSGAVVQARMGGTAPGTSGATFSAFERPTVYNGGMAFRGFLNANGDNAGGTKGQGVWAGAFGSLLPVVRTGDTTAQIPTVPAGRTVSSVWSPFSNALGSLTMRVSLVGGGETRAIMGSTGGTMRVIAKAGDAAPGLVGETFTNFDHPVIGDGDQVAFTASTNAGNYGIWKQALGGGSLSLVMKTGDTISTSEGDKTVSEISLPGATTDDRKFEARCMDAIGRLLIHVTFADGTSSLLLGQ